MSPHLARSATLAIVVASLFVVAACGKTEQAPAAAPPPPTVTVTTLTTQEVRLTRELPGRVSPRLIAEVRPQVNGIIKQRLFEEGGLVKAGQPLYQIDDATYRANLASAEAALARAQATLKSAQLNARRSEELVRVDAISRQDAENAAAALAQSQADVAASKAAVESSRLVIGHARIVAPIAGQIGRSNVTQGALVTANQAAPLATVQQLDRVYVDVTQSNSELLQLRRQFAAGSLNKVKDLSVRIVLEDGRPYSHPGRLAFSEVTVDPATGSFALRVEVPNPDHVLLPGSYVRALLDNGVRQNAVLVAQQGITRDPKGNATAMVVNKEGKVELRTVEANRTIGDKWLIDDGLAAGDRVIIEGLQKIRPGIPVTVVEASAPAVQPGSQPNAPNAANGKNAPNAPGTSGASSASSGSNGSSGPNGSNGSNASATTR